MNTSLIKITTDFADQMVALRDKEWAIQLRALGHPSKADIEFLIQTMTQK